MINIDSLEKIISEAIEDAIKHEAKIIRNDWGVDWSESQAKWVFKSSYTKACCALGAVLIKHQPTPIFGDTCLSSVSTEKSVAAFLKIKEKMVKDIIYGFDDPVYADKEYIFENLGSVLGSKYCPMTEEKVEENNEDDYGAY